MSSTPDSREWLKIKDIARLCRKNKDTIYKWINRGRVAKSGELVKLKSWMTYDGTVSTLAALQEFNDKLNEI